ncbi:MAG: methionyl-tRNA formyltransferase [Clostridia bacterium]
MKIIFLGTPKFAMKILEVLTQSRHNVVLVVCQPDKAVGRGKKVQESDVKVFAKSQNIPVLQFEKIREQGLDALKNVDADIMITAAYGQILSEEILNLKKYGIINVHGSLLPQYRGPAPIQWAIINGEKTTGITIMQTDKGMDTGDILLQKEIKIEKSETAEPLFLRLADVGGGLLLQALDQIESGTVKKCPQDEKFSSYFPMLKKEIGKIDFKKTCNEIVNLIRGLNPWPLAYFEIQTEKFKVFSASITDLQTLGECGEVLVSDSKNGLIVQCRDGRISIDEICVAGSKRMPTKCYLNGKKIEKGTMLI